MRPWTKRAVRAKGMVRVTPHVMAMDSPRRVPAAVDLTRRPPALRDTVRRRLAVPRETANKAEPGDLNHTKSRSEAGYVDDARPRDEQLANDVHCLQMLTHKGNASYPTRMVKPDGRVQLMIVSHPGDRPNLL